MVRWLTKIAGLCAFVVLGSWGIFYYQDHYSQTRQIQQLEEKNRVLNQVVQRLTDEKRVAELVVTDQKPVNGQLHTNLLLVEYDKQGHSLPPKSFDILGDMVHVDALVIKFDHDFVKQADPLRGHSIALFTRIFGDKQTPENGFPIDHPGKIPEIYRGADPRVTQYELELWSQFWRLADEESYRQQFGIRVANGQGLWWPPKPDRLYTITLESDGGMNLSDKPLDEINRALKNRATTQGSSVQ